MSYEAEGETVWHAERQADGWPNGLPEEAKGVLTGAAKKIIEGAPEGLTTRQLYERLRRDPDAKQAFGRAVVLSWLYCATERAAVAARAERVWVPHREVW